MIKNLTLSEYGVEYVNGFSKERAILAQVKREDEVRDCRRGIEERERKPFKVIPGVAEKVTGKSKVGWGVFFRTAVYSILP